jgi:hypothetical protein
MSAKIQSESYNSKFEIITHQKDYLKISIINTIFCFWFLGIPALICSIRARQNFKNGNIQEGNESARSAKLFNFIGILIGVLLGMIASLITFIIITSNS